MAAPVQATLSDSNVVQITTGAPVPTGGVWEERVSRKLALSVPAILRASSVLVTTFAALPLERIREDGTRIDLGWLAQPEPNRPRYNTWVDLGNDLIFEGISFLVIRRRAADGGPARGGCEYVSLDRVGHMKTAAGEATITVDGQQMDPRDVIAFEGWHDGICRHGARTIRIALALEAAARRYADNPSPSVVLEDESGYDLSDAEIDSLVTEYKRRRNQEGVAYTNAMIKAKPLGFDPKALQLIEARQYLALACTDLIGAPQHVVATAVATSSNVLYQNVSQGGRTLIDYGIKPLLNTVEARLSMSDVAGQAWSEQVTPRGTTVRHILDAVLRGDPMEQAQIVEILIRNGVITPDQAGMFIDLVPTGRPQA